MTIVDSSVWISFFNGKTDKVTKKFEKIVDEGEDIAILPIILLEVLSGFKNDSDYKEALKTLGRTTILPSPHSVYLESAQLYRMLRKKGVTPRGLTDCLIARACLDFEANLLSLDRDFNKIASHTGLKLWK